MIKKIAGILRGEGSVSAALFRFFMPPKGLVCILAFFVLSATGSNAVPNQTAHLSSDPRVSHARLLIESRQFTAALLILRPVVPDHPDRTDVLFLVGLAALGAAQRPGLKEENRRVLLNEAITAFLEILVQHPGLVRVRLELARAYFMARRWGRARSEFLSVLAGDIPEPVRVNVLRFLRAIDARRGFDWDADFAIVTLGDTRDYESDTIFVNLGGASLPFTLDGRDGKTARGLRYTLSAALNQAIPSLSGSKVRTLGFGRIAVAGEEGPGTRFDDLTLTGEAGMRFIWPQSSLTLAPSLSRRFLAGSAFEDRQGIRATYLHRTRKGASSTISIAWHDVDHLNSIARDGHALTGVLSTSRPITPRTLLGVSLAVEDRDAASPIDDFRRLRLTAFGVFDAGRGITLRPSVYLESKKVDRPGPAVADETGRGAALTVESRRIILGNGFTPYARFEFTRVNSDLKAFSYRVSAVSLGFERRF